MRLFTLALLLCAGSLTVIGNAAAEAEECTIPSGIKFVTNTDPPTNRLPPKDATEEFPPDCEFYRWAWQTFLYVTDRGTKRPRFLEYPTFEKVFSVPHSPLFAKPANNLLSLAPRTIQYPTKPDEPPPSQLSDLEQALSEKVLIDLHGNPVWYQIHLNQTFVDFVSANDLKNPDTLKNAPTDLEFRTGSLELKSAWKIIDGPSADYITADALVPAFKLDSAGKVTRDGTKTRSVKVALISLHVVGVIDGHPEFIWATFEHTSKTKDKDGRRIRDVAPSADSNDSKAQQVVNQGIPYLLYPGTTKGKAPPVAGANDGAGLVDLKLDVAKQKFSPPSAIYRVFPFSTQDNSASTEDPAILDLNKRIQGEFEKKPGDARANYSLVGAIWLNKPRNIWVPKPKPNEPPPEPRNDFQAGTSFPPDPADGFRGFGGENGLSSTAIESFTQTDSPNCFACHKTLRDGARLPVSRLNVSHVFSKYLKLKK